MNMTLDEFISTTAGNDAVLGKMFVFCLPSLLVPITSLKEICMTMGIDCSNVQKPLKSDAFRSATGDVRERIVNGTETCIIYFRDNARDGAVISKELIKETMDRRDNRFEKLANIWYDRESNVLEYGNLAADPLVDPKSYCEQVEQLFSKYQLCANTSHIKTIAEHFLTEVLATKCSFHGNFYFVPRDNMAKLDILEDFFDAVNNVNTSTKALNCNSFFVMNDEKQRQKMAGDFIAVTRGEIQEYTKRIKDLLNNNTQSAAIMSRWLKKADDLEGKKKFYEETFQRTINELDTDFLSLQLFRSELEVKLGGFSRAAA